MALSFVSEIVYWAYKHDPKSLKNWHEDDRATWAYTLLRRAMYGIGGLARCTFLWTRKRDFRRNELHVPHGVLELTIMRDDVREKIASVVDAAEIDVQLRFKREHDGSSRYYNDKRSRDSRDDRDRQRERRASRPPHSNDHRHRQRSSGAFYAAAAGCAWTGRAQRTSGAVDDAYDWEARLIVVVIMSVGIVIGIFLHRIWLSLAERPAVSLPVVNESQVASSPCPPNDDTSSRRQPRNRESSTASSDHEWTGWVEWNPTSVPPASAAVSETKGSVTQDVVRSTSTPASTSSSTLRRRTAMYVPEPNEAVIITPMGARFHRRARCDGLRSASRLLIYRWSECDQTLTPCQLCAGASVVNV